MRLYLSSESSFFCDIKLSKMKRFLESGSSNTKKQKTQANRKYADSYLQFGFVVKFGSENSIP